MQSNIVGRDETYGFFTMSSSDEAVLNATSLYCFSRCKLEASNGSRTKIEIRRYQGSNLGFGNTEDQNPK